jgi:hypothetical protein
MARPIGSLLPNVTQSISILTHQTDSFFYPSKKTHRYQKQTETKAKAHVEHQANKDGQSFLSPLQGNAKTNPYCLQA